MTHPGRAEFTEWFRDTYGHDPMEMEWSSPHYEGGQWRSIIEWLGSKGRLSDEKHQ